jgi:dCTP deaminase
MLKNDLWIRKQAEQGMIAPFETSLVRQRCGLPVLSYGVSSYGYDIRLSPEDFRICCPSGKVIDPKSKYEDWAYRRIEPTKTLTGSEYFVIPSNSYALGVAVEKLNVPDNVLVTCLGKSSYARIGLIVNVTPAEPGWIGHLTLEFANASSNPIRVYANEGICQLLFFEGEPCETNYRDRNGKYQDQPEKVVFAKC